MPIESSPATLANLLAQMTDNQEVLQGWDAVMNLLASSVDAFFQQQFDHHTRGAGEMTIAAVWCEGVEPFHGVYITNVRELRVVLGPPLFQFASGSAEITVHQTILSGVLRLGTKEVPSDFKPSACGCVWDDKSVSWNDPVTLDTSRGPTLSGTVALTEVQGLVGAGTRSLVLDFAQGAFVLNQLEVTGVPPGEIVDQIKDYFATQEIRYQLASLNFANVAGNAALTPTAFQFNVLTTNAGNTLVQLLITTDGSRPSSRVIDVNEPIPTADGLTCSLMVSSRILYSEVLAAGFNAGGGSFELQAYPSGQTGQIWHAAISPELHFEGSFSFGSCCDRTTVTYSIYLGGTYSGSATQGFVLNQQVHASGNAPVDITVFAANPLRLAGSGAGQTLTIVPGTPQVTVTGSVEEQIKSTLESILNDDFRRGLAGISFAPITLFALETLLFPGNLISMSQAQAPGDLLIVGTFASQG